ncbi:hypothetical protein [Myxacorys almedinensis]|uniref:Uncharacterized protein n=1 Tax=Myxacorys almedinensis A TaxID=2690445 RepID=A0A8J8CMW9_9CYAN|nr:hypothetical protein [Myxacorys almedinensis]NDJ17807.1 hypothetical protein [Myxacorys almedinensis A]
MRSKFPFGLVLLFGVLFIGFGDRILPSAIGQYSLQTRSVIDNTLIGLFPSWRPKTNPHKRTRDAIDRIEKQSK